MVMSYRHLHFLGGAVGLIAAVWFAFQLVTHDVLIFPNGYADISVVMLAAVVCSLQGLLLGVCWYVLLKGTGQSGLSAFFAISAVCIAQFAKYIPGNVAHHVGRVLLAKKAGLNVSNVLFSMFLESLLLISVAALIALLMAWIVGLQMFGQVGQIAEWWVLPTMLAVAAVSPLIGHRFFEMGARWWAERKGIAFQSVRMPSIRVFTLVSFLYVINYVILGFVLQIIATQMFGVEADILLLTGIFAVAWIVGFITPGAPAGLGVREVVLVTAFTPIFGSETAIGVTAVLRVVTVFGDCVALLFGLGLGQWVKRVPTFSRPES